MFEVEGAFWLNLLILFIVFFVVIKQEAGSYPVFIRFSVYFWEFNGSI